MTKYKSDLRASQPAMGLSMWQTSISTAENMKALKSAILTGHGKDTVTKAYYRNC